VTKQAMTRRGLLGVLGAGALTALPACRGDAKSGASEGGQRKVKIGLLVPQSGVYAPLGTDMKRGWDLFLERHGQKLGNYEVTTVTADEGESPQTGVPALSKLLYSDRVDIVVGVVSSAVALGSQDAIKEAKRLLVIANAGAGAITAAARTPYVWRTSFTNAQIAAVMGQYLAKSNAGPVYVLAPDYQAGAEVLAGFRATFVASGGQIAGEAKPPFGKTQDYQPFLAPIRQSGAKAVFCFFSGAEAVAFVKQYHQFGLSADIPLYGSGFLTEGSVLDAQGDAALGVQTTLHYSAQLDIPSNRDFLTAYRGKYNAAPTCFSVQAWDAGNVLNRALAKAAALDGDSLAKAMESVGSIDDSPRGTWGFEGQSPKQRVYLRKVEKRDDKYVNSVAADLGVFPQMA
jgi:branched-chain amino acid transport system substrate-binding protein